MFMSEKFTLNPIYCSHDPMKDFIMDPLGYFVIEVLQDEKLIRAHHYSDIKKYNCSVIGKNAEEIYHKIADLGLIKRSEHFAYIGKELYKAELYLQGLIAEFVQE